MSGRYLEATMADHGDHADDSPQLPARPPKQQTVTINFPGGRPITISVPDSTIRRLALAVLAMAATAASLGLLPPPWDSWVAVFAAGLGGAAVWNPKEPPPG